MVSTLLTVFSRQRSDSFFSQASRLPVFLYPLIFLHRFGGDGRGRFRGVVLLNVSCGSGDGSPSLATTDADCETSDQYQHQGQ